MPRRVARTESAARMESGENEESSEVHLTRPEGGTCGGPSRRAEGSERRRGGGAWRAVHAQERAAWKKKRAAMNLCDVALAFLM